ncbi:MAG TPA: hypothetical protein VKR58_08120 [Aquella sp.]|nr:hypothetical protein [Aquella sp.]
MKPHNLKSYLIQLFVGLLLVCMSSIAQANEHAKCYIRSTTNKYYEVMWTLNDKKPSSLDSKEQQALGKILDVSICLAEPGQTWKPILKHDTETGVYWDRVDYRTILFQPIKHNGHDINALVSAQSMGYNVDSEMGGSPEYPNSPVEYGALTGWSIKKNSSNNWDIHVKFLVEDKSAECEVIYYPDNSGYIHPTFGMNEKYTGPSFTIGKTNKDHLKGFNNALNGGKGSCVAM